MSVTVFGVLTHPLRRRVLLSLLERESGTLSVPEDLSCRGGDREDLAVPMYHVHLPKLTAAGYVEWDREAGRVRRGPAFEEIQPVLEALRDHEGVDMLADHVTVRSCQP